MTGPLPYDLYIRLRQMEETWPTGQDRWDGAIAACCGFQAAELCLRLVDDALRDGRPTAFPGRRVARFVAHLVEGVDLTCRLLRHTALTGEVTAAEQHPAPSVGFAVVSRLDRALADHMTRRFALATAYLPFRVGVEGQLGDARRRLGLPPLHELDSTPAVPVLDYAAVVSAETVYGLREPQPCGPEDHLFSTAHQLSECWLRVAHHYVETATELAGQELWAAADAALSCACETLPLVIQAGQLLDMMVLADYHPLRVRLRDGSGAQSHAAARMFPAARAAARPLWRALAARGLQLADVLQQPAAHLGMHRYLSSLKTLGKRLQSFLHHHYLLALGVLGTNSRGSLGYEINKLGERAARPLFPEIDQAHHDFVMFTNFLYGEASGALVLHNELADGWNPYTRADDGVECSGSVIRERVAAYFRCIEERDAEGWVRLFDPVHGQLQDVPGTRPYLGEQHLRVFIEAMFNAFEQMHGTHREVHVEGNVAVVDWHFDTISYHGRPATFEGTEEFRFGSDGRILHAVARWHPDEVARQWQTTGHEPAAGRRRVREHGHGADRPRAGEPATAA